jgi:hypothetical protein
VPDSDGRLAKVSYLFGAPSEPAAPEASRAAHDDASDDAAVSPIGDTAGPAANGRTTSSGGYLVPTQTHCPRATTSRSKKNLNPRLRLSRPPAGSCLLSRSRLPRSRLPTT